MKEKDIVIIGAGAAGCFAAALCSEANPLLKIQILEKTRQPLAKVKISGGGRCNVTHHAVDVSVLLEHYPRGREFLQGAFSRFQPKDMIAWLSSHGVKLKVESDGRMFPQSNRSQTILDCFLGILRKQEVELSLESEVTAIIPLEMGGFRIERKGGESLQGKKVLCATGGSHRFFPLLERLGHTLMPGVPSLFTFELHEEWIRALSGSVAPSAVVSLEGFSKQVQGPLLATHFGASGPAILKLSAYGARWLFERGYQANVQINWIGMSHEQARVIVLQEKKKFPEKKVVLTPVFSLSKNLWKSLVAVASPSLCEKVWAHVTKKEIESLVSQLVQTTCPLKGKSLNKEEFVTCGGVVLDEVHSRTLESKKVPGLYFAGELLDIDGVTGGFNFQAAWTTAYLAAQAMSLS